jgi:hypothetical protein
LKISTIKAVVFMAVDFSRPVSTGGVYGPDGVRRNEYSLGERPRIRGDAGSTPVPVPFVSIHKKIFLNEWYNAKLYSTLVGAKEALRLAEDDLVAAREYVAQLEKEREDLENVFG